MAKIYPLGLDSQIAEFFVNFTEKNLFYKFKEELSDLFTVFYSVKWLLKNPTPQRSNGEADFVIVHPDHGVLIIEVKGGVISFDGPTRSWYSRDKRGITHAIKDPFAQAEKNRFALLDKIKELENAPYVQTGHAALFPDVSNFQGQLPLDIVSEIIIDAEDLKDLERTLNKVITYWTRQDRLKKPLGESGVRTLEKLLASSFSIDKVPLGQEIPDHEKKLLALSAAQFNILRQLRANRKLAISGVAGSGKTLLAMEHAKKLSAEGFKTLLLCYNEPLAGHLKAATVATPGLTAIHYHGFCVERIRAGSQQLKNELQSADPKAATYFNDLLPELLLKALEESASAEKFDAIIIDEGQDFSDSMFLSLEAAFRDFKKGVFTVFYDDNQNLYRPSGEYLNAEFSKFYLNKSFRNSRPIFELLKTFYQGDPEDFLFAGLETGSSNLKPVPRAQLSLQLQKLVNSLIVNEKVLPKDLVILTANRPEKCFPDLIKSKKLGHLPLTQNHAESEQAILIESIHRFKGLERAVVILTGLEDFKPERSPNLLFVGLSRAIQHLYIVGSEEKLTALKFIGTKTPKRAA